ncbi:MAG: SpoIIE family protein phosphatase [Acidobacteria bacterium]|nr:SpoIIE family protein phosphatase [Acidobacteriota bacterium]
MSAERTVADLSRLLEVSRHLGATIELQPLLAGIERAALDVLRCERASVFILDRERGELFSRLATGVQEIRFPADRGIAGEAAQRMAVVNVPDAYADPRFNPEIDKTTGYRTRSILTLPMIGHDGELMGVLQLLNKLSGPFTANDEELARTLGALAGVALQRQLLLEAFAEKKKLERDLAIARDIQQGILPDAAPALDGFDIAGWNKPADETGGDLFDFIEVAKGRVGVMAGDATGHGIGPALVAVECRALIRALALSTPDLAHILGTTNTLLAKDLSDSRFVTLCLAFVDGPGATIAFASAGHGPLLHYRAATDSFQELEISGPPLGLFDGMSYEPPPPIAMARGDMFIVPTDGFYEYTGRDGTFFGNARIQDVMRAHRHEPAAVMAARLYDAVMAFAAGAPQLDDMTVVIVKRLS